MNISRAITLMLLFISVSTYGTIDRLYVNEICKEYQYSDNGCKGLIGWKSVDADPSKYSVIHSKLVSEGYTYSSFPNKIDLLAISSLGLLFFIIFYEKTRRVSKKMMYGSPQE